MKHRDTAIKKKCIGVIHYWKFKNSFLFLNFEKGIIENIKSPKDVSIITSEEFNKLYEERNVKKGNQREQTYGKVHEKWIKIMGQGTTDKTGLWSMDFGRDINTMDGILRTYKEMVQHFGKLPLKEMQEKEIYREIAMKNLFRPMDKEKMDLSDKAFEELITEEEIKNLVAEFKKLPKDWTDKLKFMSEEAKHYIKTIPASEKEIEIKKFNKAEIITAEKELLKNLSEDKVKVNFNGHAPYGWELKREVEKDFRREKDLKDKTESQKEEYYSVNPLIGSLVNKDGKCHHCGEKVAYKINSTTDAEVIVLRETNPEARFREREIKEVSEPCKFKSKKSRIKPFEVEFQSGKVTIANFFLDKDGEYLFDVPKEEKYSDKYSLQYLSGRFNIQDYISKTYNAGYGQTGNMSADVFVSKDKKKIIIGSEPNDWSEKKRNEKAIKEFESKYTKVGEVCMDVWRYEFADKTELKKYKGHKVREGVDVEVKPGKYVAIHYLGNVACEKDGEYSIYAEIELKQ